MEFGWEVDPKVQDEGEYKSFDAILPGLEVKLRSVRSPIYRRAVQKIAATDTRWQRQGIKGDRYRDEKTRELIAEVCILDWRVKDAKTGEYGPLRDRAGTEVPCSPAMRRELMTDRAHQKFADQVFVATGQVGEPEEAIDDAEEGEDDLPS